MSRHKRNGEQFNETYYSSSSCSNVNFYVIRYICISSNFQGCIKLSKRDSFLVNRGVINGFQDGTFKPQRNLTRLQAVIMLFRDQKNIELDAADPGLSDITPESNGYKEVAKAVELGIISGKTAEDGTKYFDPQGVLTRGQMAKILVKAYNLPINNTKTFKDVNSNNSMKDFISTLAFENITSGYENGTFGPNNKVSREHFAVFMARLLEKSFRPEERVSTGSFMMDRSKVYKYKGPDDFSATHTFEEQLEGYDRWYVVATEGYRYDAFKEDKNGFYAGYYGLVMKYPLKKGNSWKGNDDVTYTILATDRVVKTGAGEFKNVVEVESSDGRNVFYAPNAGIVKYMFEGNLAYQLEAILNK